MNPRAQGVGSERVSTPCPRGGTWLLPHLSNPTDPCHVPALGWLVLFALRFYFREGVPSSPLKPFILPCWGTVLLLLNSHSTGLTAVSRCLARTIPAWNQTYEGIPYRKWWEPRLGILPSVHPLFCSRRKKEKETQKTRVNQAGLPRAPLFFPH